MIHTHIKTTKTTKRWNYSKNMEDRFDHTYTLKRVNGATWLNTWTEKDGSYFSGSTAKIEDEDPLIQKLFHGLEFDSYEYDGCPVFKRGDDTIYLYGEGVVNMGDDAYTI